jgi:hypothetical protein
LNPDISIYPDILSPNHYPSNLGYIAIQLIVSIEGTMRQFSEVLDMLSALWQAQFLFLGQVPGQYAYEAIPTDIFPRNWWASPRP